MSGKKRNVMLFVLLFTLLLGVIVPVQAQSYGGTKIIRVAYREDADFPNKNRSQCTFSIFDVLSSDHGGKISKKSYQ